MCLTHFTFSSTRPVLYTYLKMLNYIFYLTIIFISIVYNKNLKILDIDLLFDLKEPAF